MRHVIVIGGGASGLVAAITAARNGAKVTIIEKNDRLGRKILSTGNGRCNLTNEYMTASCFRGDDVTIVSHVLQQFGYEDTIRFFEELGVLLRNRQGYIYPISDQASTICDALEQEVKIQNIHLALGQTVTRVTKKAKGFAIKTEQAAFTADAVILATGGKAAPKLGSDGSGYEMAKSFGHHLAPVLPALVQLKCKGNFFKQVAGVRAQAKVTLCLDGQPMASDIGELQLTNYGISGIPVFQISRFAARGLYDRKPVTAEIDFMPHMSDTEFQHFMEKRLSIHGHKNAEHFFLGMFHQKIIRLLLHTAGIHDSKCMNDVEQEKTEKIITLCKHFKIEVEACNGFEQAQVCAGGIRTTEIHIDSLESLCAEDLYLVGELLDIDGICGGYNLQWAWATGYIAGAHAAKGK